MAPREDHPTFEFPVDPPLPERLPEETSISEVKALRYISCLQFYREEIERYVEQPLVEACRILFDKGIPTTLTSANQEDLAHGVNGVIFLDYLRLSEPNRAILRKIGRIKTAPGSPRPVGILDIPIIAESRVCDVSEYAATLAKLFEAQDSVVWPE